jgi:hypothetical protein
MSMVVGQLCNAVLPWERRCKLTNQSPALEQLTAFIATIRNDDPFQLVADLEKNPPQFLFNEFLDKPVRSLWGSLPMEARLLAYLWMYERNVEEVSRGERSL